MAVKIGLISDIHAYSDPLAEALQIFRAEEVAMTLCLGDVAGYGTELAESVALLQQSGCTTILGNHEAWFLDRMNDYQGGGVSDYFSALPEKWEAKIEGVGLCAVHASPLDSLTRGIRLLDEDGRVLPVEKARWAEELAGYPFDVLLVGHTHQVFAEWLGEKLVINPGSTKFNNTCAILTLPQKNVRIFPLSGKQPLTSWNWGLIARL